MPARTVLPADRSAQSFVERWRLAAVCVALVALALKQAPERVVGDTKLGIAVDPAGFLTRALHLWDPSTDFGVTQNQSYGYLFPMGPTFLLGHTLQLPPWLIQRVWWALLLCLAFIGFVRLAGRLGIGSPTTRIVAGVAFALSPRLVSTLGPISVESLPYCLAPWVVVPLIDGSRGGSTRRAAARSAVAVLCMGAVNAAAVLAALPPAALWLLTRKRGPRRRSLTLWWVAGVLLATGWWVLPLLLQSRYSPPFLDYIESAATTTSVTSLIETLRGTSDWVAYLAGSHGPTWPAGFALLTEVVTIALTMVVVVAGVAGLVHRQIPERLWLVLCLLVGVAAVTFGHVGPLSPPWAGAERHLLDGGLAPFRNVHKFDVVLRLPLVLGLAHLVHRLLSAPVEPGPAGLLRRRAVLLGAVAAVIGAALPAVSPGLAARHPFVALPSYWQQAADWLAEHPEGRTLVLPGSSAVDYLWGSPNDEPLQVLARTPWAVRGAIPLTPAGTIRALDAIEARLAAGRPSAGLASTLNRDGVRYVLVRNDLDYGATGSTRPLLVHAALIGSPGIQRVASFGGRIGGGTFGRFADEGLEVPYPALEIFQVGQPVPRASLHHASDAVRVLGGPEAILNLDDRGLLQGRPVLLGDESPGLVVPTVLTDSLRKREVFFGQQQDNASATLTTAEPYRLAAPAHDYLSAGTADQQAVAGYLGVHDIAASSSGSDAGNFGGAQPEHLPYAAMDGDPNSSWRSGSGQDLEKAYWQVFFTQPQQVTDVSLRVEKGLPGAQPTSLRVSGDHGATVVVLPIDGRSVRVSVPGGASRQLRVQVAGVRDGVLGVLGLFEVSVPGVAAQRTVVTVPAAGQPTLTVDAASGNRDGCYPLLARWLCGSRLARASEDGVGLDRTFGLTSSGTYLVTQAWAKPRSGAALAAVLARDLGFTIIASSSAVSDPRGAALAAMDGLSGTGWRADRGDRDPRLTVTWPGVRTLSQIQVVVDDTLAVSRPRSVRLTSDGGERTVALDGEGRATFRPLRTAGVTVHLLRAALTATVDPYAQTLDYAPVGVSELRFPGQPPVLSVERPVTLACGAGPDVVVNGQVVQTALRTTTAALADLAPVALTVCGSGRVSAGSPTRIRAAATNWLAPISLTLQPVSGPLLAPDEVTALSTPEWTSTRRSALLPARTVQTLLQVPENANAGWRATLGGVRLAPIVLDGWQQGWLIPPGTAGLVELRFTPDRWYRWGLLVGLLLVLALVGLTRPVLSVRGEQRRRRGLPAAGPRHVSWPWIAAAGLLLMLFGGAPAAAAMAGLFVLVRRHGLVRRFGAALGPVAVAAGGLLLVWQPWTTPGYAGRGGVTQALCTVGLAAVWSGLLPITNGTEATRRGARSRRVVSRRSGRSRQR